MCEPMSWIEYDGNVYFLTAKDLRTKEGRELKKYLGSAYKEDVVGHGAIDNYFGLMGQGVHHEVNDFTDPSRFPPQIVEAIKAGAFNGMFICPQILTVPAWAEYKKIRGAALAEYEKIKGADWDEYEKIRGAAWDEYEKITQTSFWCIARKPENRIDAWK